MKRRNLSKLARVRIFDAAGGICGICGLKIHAERGERWHADHDKPLHMGGADDETNLRPVHDRCHFEKNAAEAPVKAKTDRVRAKHLGIRKPSRFPGAKTSKWRQKLNGKWEPRA